MKIKRTKPVGNRSTMAPRPVHPRAIRYHGLFGEVYIKQHMMMEDLWTPMAIKEQFKRMSKLLAKRVQFSQLEKRAKNKKIVLHSRELRKECSEGRNQLHTIRQGDTQGVRNLLQNHRDMQRLYHQMPPHQVMDNINQRTFVMRKERDRLESRMAEMKTLYNHRLLELGNIQNRIKYQNEFLLDEEVRCWDLTRKIEDSCTRFSAIKAINVTYRKIVQVLRYDENFYEPILKSLDSDIQDQGGFIKHILFLGSPALVRFRQLGEEYRIIDDKTRKSIHSSIQQCSEFRKYDVGRAKKGHVTKSEPEMFLRLERRYERETSSMINLRNELQSIEKTIKKIKFATLISQEKDIYPRIKNQVDSNHKLHQLIENEMLGREVCERKMKFARIFEGVLNHNFDGDRIRALEKIQNLEEALKNEDNFQEQTLAHIKNRSDVFVLLRFALWNLHEIMRHVAARRMRQPHYPNKNLKLPLLKFKMLDMRACPPEPFEENIPALLQVVTQKFQILLYHFNVITKRRSSIRLEREAYCHDMLETMGNLDAGSQGMTAAHSRQESNVALNLKALQGIPNRKDIKMASARLVEEMAKQGE